MARKVTRKQLLAASAPIVVAAPLAKLGFADGGRADAAPGHDSMPMPMPMPMPMQMAMGHAAMIGAEVPARGGPHDLDALLYPPPALPHKPGRVREYTLTAADREIEVID